VLCGRRMIPDNDVDALYRASFDPTRPTPATLGVDVGDWEPILARALALDPRDRYASAGELLAALEGARRAEPPSATPAGTEREEVSRAPTQRTYARAAGLTAVAAGLLAAAWLVIRHRGPTTTAPAAACTSNAACSRLLGGPAICHPGVGCVALRSPDCEPFADPRALDSDATVWLGSMFPRSGPDAAAFGTRETNALELARRDFAHTRPMLDGARPLGLIACDDAVDPHRAANHLVETVGVPAVIGFYKVDETIELTSLFLKHRVLAIASVSTNPLITTGTRPEGIPRLVWRTTYNSANAAAALSALVADRLEPALRAGGGERARRAMRVALLRPSDVAGAALSDAFASTLRFNGTNVVDNGSNFREMTVTAEAPRTSPEYARLRDELLEFAPDIILYAANAAIVEAVFAPLEKRWPRNASHRPRYASIALLPPELLGFIGASADRRSRFFGVTSVGSTATNRALVTHYNETFSDRITLTIDPNASYDAFYLLAFATYAIPGTERVTGERLARAFGKLVPPGRQIEVGLTGIPDAYTVLSRDESIDLIGATGTLDFDLATGEAAFDLAILCAGVDEHGKASDGIESGLVYSTASNTLTGEMRCP
jgi:ABC-type branched-subunit amino acid transport system substrate-binding protein